MTADVVVLADWRRSRARQAATRAGHPSAAGRTAALAGHLVVIPGGTVAHAVDWTIPVPDVPAYRVTAHTAVFTYCGRCLDADDLEPRTGDTPRPCKRCTTVILRRHRESS